MSLFIRSSKTLSEELTLRFLISRDFKNEGSNSLKYLSELAVPLTSISPIIQPVHTVLHNHRKNTVLSCPSLGLCEQFAVFYKFSSHATEKKPPRKSFTK